MNANSPKAKELFVAALRLPAEQWDDYLNRACHEDEATRRRVHTLLHAHREAGSFLQGPAPGLLDTMVQPAASEAPGTVIGPYKLLEQIGEGGMGTVFAADQAAPVRRRVALKVIKPGMDTREVIARFDAERQALAMMEHPNIARVFDAGTTASGRPYFVMELVRGLPITDYCDQAGLTLRRRLELFVAVCQAIQHAHQKGIIHRDIKPSNVLITLHDGTPVVKVIDFGLAKALHQRLTEQTVYTRFTQLLGTPLYMSPEQAELSGLDVDTRSDVYSLGVLLYELLTGTTPFSGQTLRTASLDEIRRIIREDEPLKPSTRLSSLGAEARSTVSRQRGLDDRQLGQQLRGELDWIVMKALDKDRNRRYESAGALAADVERYLNDEPVAACPPSASYRLRKLARRHRRLLVTVGVIATVLVLATAVSTWQALRARAAQHEAEADRREAEAARDRAEAAESRATTEAAIAPAVNDFLQRDLLAQAASAAPPGQEIGADPYLTVRAAVQRAAAQIGQRFRDQPVVEAAIRTSIGAAYNQLHHYQLGVPHLERAVALRMAHLGPDHADTLDSMQALATACESVGRFPDAIALRQQILQSWKTLLRPDHPKTLGCVARLAIAYREDGQWDTSVPLLEQLLEKQRAVCGPAHPDTLSTMHDLAMNYMVAERYTESMALHEKLLELCKSTNGPQHQPPAWYLRTFAQACQDAGKLDQAERLLREDLEQTQKLEDSPGRRQQRANALGWLARNLLLQQQYAAAEPLVQEAVAIHEKQEPEVPRRFYWVSLWGAVLAGQQKYAAAEPLLVQGYEGLKQRETIMGAGGRKRRLAEAGAWVVRFYEMTGQPEKAQAWREKTKAKPPGKK
jgi:serine/threonine protein kinase